MGGYYTKRNSPKIEIQVLQALTCEKKNSYSVMVAKGWEKGELGRCWSKGTEFQYERWLSSGNNCSVVTIANNTLLHT